MAMATIHHELVINAPVERVYEALSSADQIGTWWDKQTAVPTDHGLVLEHNPGAEHGVVKLKVVKLVPHQRVEWECISVHSKTSPASAWTGTHFIFELAERKDSSGVGRHRARTTTIDFQQTGYDERSQYFEANRAAWGDVLRNLKRVVESGRS
jgi:uncharacterized protein YndB with AHSA1/START domain